MERKFLKSVNQINDLPQDLIDYIIELELLYNIPFSYLISEESLLPSESLRFFHVDKNWTKALVDGALSIGRVTKEEYTRDQISLNTHYSKNQSISNLPRYKRMHQNHKELFNKRFNLMDNSYIGEVVSGFILNSELVRLLKGLEVSGYNNNQELLLLKLETFSNDIAIGLFQGEITSLKIAEPKTGLIFGLTVGENQLTPKDITDSNLGKPLREKRFDITPFKNEKGRLDANKLSKHLSTILNAEIDASRFAFELIAVANRVFFEEKSS